MARLNLIDVIKCRNKITIRNLSAKNIVNTLLLSFAGGLGSIVGSISQIIGKAVGVIKNAEDDLNNLENQLKADYDQIIKSLHDIKMPSGTFDTTCTDAEATSTNNQISNVVAEIISLPDSNNPDIVKNSPVAAFKKSFNDSKSRAKSTPLIGMAKQVGDINNHLSEMGILEIREYVRQYKNLHPLIDSYVNNLSYFTPVSENIGASFIGYTIDKPALQLEYWNTTPMLIRQNIKHKIRPEIYNEAQSAYSALNTRLVENVSNEFWTEFQTENRTTAGKLQADDYHIKGDWWWYSEHIVKTDETGVINPADPDSNLIKQIKAIIFQKLGNQVMLIEYLTNMIIPDAPFVENIRVSNDTYEIVEEGVPITVDKRNNPVYFPSTSINNDVLKPVISPET